jgi:two-component system sensor histidine kinase HydH
MTERRWDFIGLAAGAAVGVGDVALFSFFGAEMELGGYDVASLVLALFIITYSGLGFAAGRLAMARAKSHEDAEIIGRQLAELERTQRELVEKEKLAAIGRLAAGIAHEVRNPLGVIRASASLAQESFSDGEDSYRACQFICEETDRLDGLIASLLAFARPTTPQVQPIVVDDVLSCALRLVADELERRHISAEYSATPELPKVEGDPDLLSQAVLDLALNAAEALDHDGRILVRASGDQGMLCVDVCDDGPGVPRDIAEQIFEPFFTTKAKGTGLGLAMASRIVEAHGGRVELVDDGGLGDAGACFRIRLPTVPELRV